MIKWFAVILLAVVLSSFGWMNLGIQQANGLVMALRCNEQGGKISFDGSPLKNICTLTGSPFFVRDAVSFSSGTSDYIDCGNKSCMTFTTKMTVSFWIKRQSGTLGHVGKYAGLNVDKAWLLQIFSDNKIYWVIPSATQDNYIASTSTYTDQNWMLITAVYDGLGAGNSTRAMCYVNGMLMAGTYFGTIPSSLNNSTKNVEINRYNATTYGTCLMKDIRLYNRALTANEVKELYVNSKALYKLR